jgi:hypothetical protein
MQRTPVAALILLLLIISSVGADCIDLPNTDPKPEVRATDDAASLPTNFPTPAATPSWKTVQWTVAQNTQDAAGFARELIFNSEPPFKTIRLDSVQYAPSVAGNARQLVNYTREEDRVWAVADQTPVVLFVAHGAFECFSDRFSEGPAKRSSTMWVIVPLGERGTRAGCSDDTYELTSLGEVKTVPLPLAPFPSPVSIEDSVGN